MKKLILLAAAFLCGFSNFAQCPSGQIQVSIDISTDDYGYEGYWELVPTGNQCGTGTVAMGGNPNVGCNGGGQQHAAGGSGYASNSIIHEGPYCLDSGVSYDLIIVDDYGDGGTSYNIFIDSLPMYTHVTADGDAPGSRFTFSASPPAQNDIKCTRIKNSIYEWSGNVMLKASIINRGTDTLHSLTMNYSIDNGAVNSSAISGLNIPSFDSMVVTNNIPWNALANGSFNVEVWFTLPNGNIDPNPSDDSASKKITIGPGIPDLINGYINTTPAKTIIGDNISNDIDHPRDLDFQTILSKNELWVVLEGTENSGGSTVKFSDAGLPTQTSLLQQDGNAWHFMSLPTALAFSDDGNFATSPGVFDANHTGGNTPFTGPTLWSSDSLIYAHTPPGGNGSHIDMLHQSPHSMGIANETDNIFWINDGYTGDIVRYDFVNDHGPGNSDHSDGVIRRFTGMGLNCDPAYEVPGHVIFQKETGMLFIVDTDNDRILRMNTRSGVLRDTLVPYEATAEYTGWDSVSYSVFADSGLTTPCGIEILNNHLLVSDYATGDIIIYDNSSAPGTELGRIHTEDPGIMGIKIGPDGKIWYVNALTDQVVRLESINVGIEKNNPIAFTLYPNPANSDLNILMNNNSQTESFLKITDVSGRLVSEKTISAAQKEMTLDINSLNEGVYTVSITSSEGVIVKRFVKE